MYSKYKLALSINLIFGKLIYCFITSLKEANAADVPRREALNLCVQ